MIQIYSLKLERELNERERQQTLDILTPERKAKALRFRRFEDQSKSMLAGLLEAYALQKDFGIPWQKLRIQVGENGKPFVLNAENAQYNLSHSGRWIVCGTGKVPLGIDVEQSVKYSERIVKRFFQPDEVEDILSNPEESRPEIFAEYWTMKESFMKLCGKGFAVPLSCFCTNRGNGEITFLAEANSKLDGGWLQTHPVCQFVELEEGYKCAVCTIQKQQLNLKRVTREDCLRELNPSAVETDNLTG